MANHNGDAAVGVDVSKAHLDAWRPDEAKRFGNDAEGFEEFAAWVAPADPMVVYESTGHHHRGEVLEALGVVAEALRVGHGAWPRRRHRTGPR